MRLALRAVTVGVGMTLIAAGNALILASIIVGDDLMGAAGVVIGAMGAGCALGGAGLE